MFLVILLIIDSLILVTAILLQAGKGGGQRIRPHGAVLVDIHQHRLAPGPERQAGFLLLCR